MLDFIGAGPCLGHGAVVRSLSGGLLFDGRRMNITGLVPRLKQLSLWVHRRFKCPRRPLWPGAVWSRSDLHVAWLGGLSWLAERVAGADLGELSDLVQALFIYSRSSASVVVRRLARRYLIRAARRYDDRWRRRGEFETVENFFDAVSAFFYLREMGMAPKDMGKTLRFLRKRWSDAALMRRREGAWDQSPERLLDTLVDLYFLDAVGMRTPIPYDNVVRRAMSWPLRPTPSVNPAVFEAQTYLATHLVYVLSDFETRRVPGAVGRRILSYLETAARFYLQVGDLETLGEIIDCMKILGVSYEKRVVRSAVNLFMKSQHRAGDWGNSRDSYSRYHTTWTVLSGLMEYDLKGKPTLRL